MLFRAGPTPKTGKAARFGLISRQFFHGGESITLHTHNARKNNPLILLGKNGCHHIYAGKNRSMRSGGAGGGWAATSASFAVLQFWQCLPYTATYQFIIFIESIVVVEKKDYVNQ